MAACATQTSVEEPVTENTWLENSRPFLEAIDAWYGSLPSLATKDVIVSPARLAVVCIDDEALALVGRLVSERVDYEMSDLTR